MTTRSIIAKRVAVLATSLGVLAGASPASAAPLDKGRFEESGTEVVENLCGDLDVVHNWHVTGNYLGRVKGSSGLAVLPRPHHGNERVHQPRDRQVVQQCVRAPAATTSRRRTTGMAHRPVHVQGSGTEPVKIRSATGNSC